MQIKYRNIYKVFIMAVLAAIILSLSMRLFRNPEKSKESIVRPETATKLTEEDITVETERNQVTMATYPDEVEAGGGGMQPEIYSPWKEEDYTVCCFADTGDTIDVDSTLPVGARGRLTDDAQRYLDSEGIRAAESRCTNGTITTKGPEASFQVQYDDMGKTITVMTYDKNLHA